MESVGGSFGRNTIFRPSNTTFHGRRPESRERFPTRRADRSRPASRIHTGNATFGYRPVAVASIIGRCLVPTATATHGETPDTRGSFESICPDTNDDVHSVEDLEERSNAPPMATVLAPAKKGRSRCPGKRPVGSYFQALPGLERVLTAGASNETTVLEV
ncbi:hypothetical protein CP557_18805 [Natrinema ejinorense]|uniref:Uncharacterized protein n=1 Tax=Natrinema ejinorense TaxID=373386 RepID=A0A2A5QZW6_9EURY|nr:hypothetical protein CP557_18805 [Natrinema ejinorense]